MINEKTNASATTSSCTYDTTYFNTPIYNTLAKCGQVVCITFTAEVKAAIPNNTYILTNLPLILNSYTMRMPFLFGNTQYIASPTYYQGGNLTNATAMGYAVVNSYAIADSYVGKFLHLSFTYISKE